MAVSALPSWPLCRLGTRDQRDERLLLAKAPATWAERSGEALLRSLLHDLLELIHRCNPERRARTAKDGGQRLRANRCNELHFRRQQVIAGFIADFYCHAARVIVELDGSIHQRTGKYDSARDTALAARGLRILRFTNDDVMYHREQIIEHITAECEARIATRLPAVTSVSAPGATPSVTGSPPLTGEGVRG